MKKNIAILLEYDGSRYSGWQRQGNTDNTIENKLQNVLEKMCGGASDIEIHGSGRTDAGVHARGQVANFHIATDMSGVEIMDYLNRYLPDDIRVLNAYEADERFHARLLAVSKCYEYSIELSKKAGVFTRKYTWCIGQSLDKNKMYEASRAFVGRHDFAAFTDMKPGKKKTEREIFSIDIIMQDENIRIIYNGDGFLYHMVRKMTAALVDAGKGKMTAGDIEKLLLSKDNKAFNKLAPAEGLTLVSVKYN